MKLLLSLFFLVATFSLTNAQVQLSTPLEILTFMEASPTQYELEQLYGEVPAKERKVLPHGAYIQAIDGREHQLEYKDTETEEQIAWREKARDIVSIENPNYEKARRYYHKILKKNPQHAQVYTWIGESYYEEKNYKKAATWLNKAIELNPIDYLARWLSAEILLKKGQIDSALYTLTLAHIYNRNHPRLIKRLVEVYEQQGQWYYRNWGFDPLMYIYKDGETVVVTAEGIWLTYGMYKAVWNYDTDYQYIKEQQEVTDYLFQQEMEAIIGTYMTYTNLKKDDKRNYPVMNAFGLCLDHEMVEEFVLYEILLVDKPSLSHHITPLFMKRVIKYIAQIRSVDYVIDEE
ncbi:MULTISPECIES: M48 family metallopeptidase [unclassified Aureispira]|uniref:tetratricopeptide repeat protein n=1 Tax=unclassified Aureispira TaxID=2649989 RepID=UPI0007C7CACB|nr:MULTISPECIES: tetratricopeptide repeat protein [unclassified Aureispira]WMX14040.1 tetratricopeptide repeat protein [Aureispira sp. CCB-E]